MMMETFPVFARQVEAAGLRQRPVGDPMVRKGMASGRPARIPRVTWTPKQFTRQLILTAAEKAALETFEAAIGADSFWWFDVAASLFRTVGLAAPVEYEVLGLTGLWRATVLLEEDVPTTYDIRPPIRHFKCDDNAATTVVLDASPNGGNLTASENTSGMHGAGKVGTGSLTFNGSTQKLTATQDLGWDGLTHLALALWIDPTVSEYTIIAKTLRSWATFYVGYYDGGLMFEVMNESESAYGRWKIALPATGQWSHLAFSWSRDAGSAADLVAYVNGATVQAAFTQSGYDVDFELEEESSTLEVGGFGTDYYTGVVDDVRVYDVALTAAEVALLYNGGSGRAD